MLVNSPLSQTVWAVRAAELAAALALAAVLANRIASLTSSAAVTAEVAKAVCHIKSAIFKVVIVSLFHF